MHECAEAVSSPEGGVVRKELRQQTAKPEECHSCEQPSVQLVRPDEGIGIEKRAGTGEKNTQPDEKVMHEEHFSRERRDGCQFLFPPEVAIKKGVAHAEEQEQDSDRPYIQSKGYGFLLRT